MRNSAVACGRWLALAAAPTAMACWLAVALAQPTLEPRTPLPWAFALDTPGATLPADDGELKRVPDSDRAFSITEIRNLYNPPDWHPGDHPPMPPIVAQGRDPGVYACGYCHLPNGLGRPENASLAGLRTDYIVQQMQDYKSGRRRSSEPRMVPPAAMLAIGINATDAEVRSAAEYFASLTPRKWIRVVETDSVPETRVQGWMHVAVEGGGTEPIGQRIIEMPEDLERTELRDFRSGFVAYVPMGSVARGRELVRGGSDETQPCVICHGTDLRGLGPVPPLAGRSPSYVVRQLYDFKSGSRDGLWAPLMQAAVSELETEDLVAIAAYTASLDP